MLNLVNNQNFGDTENFDANLIDYDLEWPYLQRKSADSLIEGKRGSG